jgi:hypothetical protein
MSELDGEVRGCEVISKASSSYPYDAARYFDKDNFYPMDGEVISMVAANAAQNTGDYFDQDNFYPADGVKVDQEGTWTDVEFSDARGIFKNIKDYFSPEERSQRKDARRGRRAAKTDEIRSRAELNRSLTQDKPSDVALAQALSAAPAPSQRPTGRRAGGMSRQTKTLLIVGSVVLVGGIAAFLLLRKKK